MSNHPYHSSSISLDTPNSIFKPNSLYHAVGNLFGHLGFGHLELWYIAGGIARAVDGGGEVIDNILELDALKVLGGRGDFFVSGYGGEVNHIEDDLCGEWSLFVEYVEVKLVRMRVAERRSLGGGSDK